MKTIIHLELNDLERNDLAKRIDREDTKRLVTRKEVTDLVNALVQDEVTQGWESTTDDRGPQKNAPPTCEQIQGPEWKPPAAAGGQIFIPSRGDEDYLTQPKDPGVAAACSRILDDTKLIEEFAWNTIERIRK
jgi:hypothetical protein